VEILKEKAYYGLRGKQIYRVRMLCSRDHVSGLLSEPVSYCYNKTPEAGGFANKTVTQLTVLEMPPLPSSCEGLWLYHNMAMVSWQKHVQEAGAHGEMEPEISRSGMLFL
jgi:hypothetical protein